jgi:ergothioneine biosynthesis protein EgtB
MQAGDAVADVSRPLPAADARDRILAVYLRTRARTESLAARLSPEDQQLQSMADASPTKWHRAHTTWFFETFVLEPAGRRAHDPRYAFLFNSYYGAVGPQHARPKRGMISRPTVADIGDYRRVVDDRLTELLATANAATLERALPVVELGIAHEEQHQELLLTDILHAFSENPLSPAFLADAGETARALPSGRGDGVRFVSFEGGLHDIGAGKEVPFVFDNERPRHKQWVEPFALADRLVTVGELKAFLREGGYQTQSLWLSDGFDLVRSNQIRAPLYSAYEDGELRVFTLAGPRIAGDDEPAVHVSYYEADAIARFLGARLPSEAEWEIAASQNQVRGNFIEAGMLRPVGASEGAHGMRQLFGDAWEWTRSSYDPYPAYQPPEGALGEYNGKFMINQRVLRGGSCLTPQRHVRASYRNFWHPQTRFQMAGIRLAREVST